MKKSIFFFVLLISTYSFSQDRICFRKLLDNGILISVNEETISVSHQPQLDIAIHYVRENNTEEYRLLLRTVDDLAIPQGARLKIKTSSGRVFDLINSIDDYPYDGQLLYWVKRAIFYKKHGHTKGGVIKAFSDEYNRLYSTQYDVYEKGGTYEDGGIIEALKKSMGYFIGGKGHTRGSYLVTRNMLQSFIDEGITAIRMQTSKENYDWTFDENAAKKISMVLANHLSTIDHNLDPLANFGKEVISDKTQKSPASPSPTLSTLQNIQKEVSLTGTWESDDILSNDERIKSHYCYHFKPYSEGDTLGTVDVILNTRSTYDVKDASIIDRGAYYYSGTYHLSQNEILIEWDISSVKAELLEFNPFRSKMSEKQKAAFIASMKQQLPDKMVESLVKTLMNENDGEKHPSIIHSIDENTIIIVDTDPASGSQKETKFHRSFQ